MIPYVVAAEENTGLRSAQHPLGGHARDVAGNAGIGLRAAGVEDAPKVVPPVGFDDAVDGFAHGEAGPHADDEGRVGEAHADVPFGERGFNDDFGAEAGDGDALRIDHDRDAPGVPERGDFFGPGGEGRRDAFHRAEALIDGFGKGHPAPDGHRMRRFQNDDVPEAGTVEPERDARSDVPAAAEKNGKLLVLVHAATPAARRKVFPRTIYQ